VGLTTDPDYAPTALVTAAEGGTISGRAGADFGVDVTVPAGALPADEVLRLVPVKAATGLPGGRLLAGVRIEPEGIEFASPVTVSFYAPSLPPLGQLAGATTLYDGEALLFQPLGEEFGMPQVRTFESGAVLLLEADLAAAGRRAATTAATPKGPSYAATERAIVAPVTRALSAERQGQLNGSNANAGAGAAAMEKAARKFVNQIVKPKTASISTLAGMSSALQSLFTIDRALQLMGMESTRDSLGLDALRDEIVKKGVKAFEKLLASCGQAQASASTPGPKSIARVQTLLGAARGFELLGEGGRISHVTVQQILDCIHVKNFKVQIDATHSESGEGTGIGIRPDSHSTYTFEDAFSNVLTLPVPPNIAGGAIRFNPVESVAHWTSGSGSSTTTDASGTLSCTATARPGSVFVKTAALLRFLPPRRPGGEPAVVAEAAVTLREVKDDLAENCTLTTDGQTFPAESDGHRLAVPLWAAEDHRPAQLLFTVAGLGGSTVTEEKSHTDYASGPTTATRDATLHVKATLTSDF
jgi:hypothetical protein